MSLPRYMRLTSRPVFNRVLKSQRLGHCRFGSVLAIPKLPQHGHLPTQIGIVISKKVHKRAHERNRLKRQFKALLQEALATRPGMHRYRAWVLIVRAEAVGQPFATLQAEWVKTLDKCLTKPVTPTKKVGNPS